VGKRGILSEEGEQEGEKEGEKRGSG